jgi:prephenate dehydrogenase
MAMDATQHDDLMAVVSHVPQLAASALMHLASARGTKHAGALVLAAGGFRDVTRIAASNPDLWLEICFENREAILAELEQFSKEMSILDRYLRSGDSRNLRGYLAEASAARRQLGRKEVGGRLFEISLVIPDRPGVLAHVTRLIGDLAINIEDISISHSSEGGRGSLHLVIEGEEKAAKVRVALELQQYSIKSKEI